MGTWTHVTNRLYHLKKQTCVNTVTLACHFISAKHLVSSAILKLLIWLDQSPLRFWSGVCICYGFCIFLVIFSIGAKPDGGEPESRWKKWMRHDLLFVLSMCAVVFSCRWPFLLCPTYINPDEALFSSCGITLWHDPVFWRSISASTSGPLNVYPLLIPKLLGFSFGYVPARVVGLLLVLGTISCLYFTARKFMCLMLARMSVLPVLTFFAFAVNPDFVHYSSEHVSLLLLSASVLALAVFVSSSRRHGWMTFAAGLVVGAVPFAKLQSIPLGIVMGFSCLLVLWGCKSPLQNRLKDCAIYAAGVMVVPLFFFVMTMATGCFDHMLNSYLLANANYAKRGLSLAASIGAFPKFLVMNRMFSVWLGLQLAAGLLLLIVVLLLGGMKSFKSFSVKLPIFSAALLIVAAFSVIAPGRHYGHYLLYLTIPSALWLMACTACFGQWANSLKKPLQIQAVTTFLMVGLVSVVSMLWLYKTAHERNLGGLEKFTSYRGTPAGNAIRNLGLSGQSLAVWGWMYELFVETDMWSATSDSVLTYSWVRTGRPEDTNNILPNYLDVTPGYFKNLYIADLAKNKPPVFVDAVSPHGFFYVDRLRHGYETFPPLAAFINGNYHLITEVDGVRIFIRNDLQPPASGGRAQ